MTQTLPEFLARCAAFGAVANHSRATVSTRVLNDGKRLQALHDGAGMTTARLTRAFAKLAELEARLIQGRAA